MKKNRKLTKLLLAAAIAAAATIGAACEKDESAHEHSFGKWEVTVAPTCAKEGEQERVCDCGEKQTQKIAKTEHENVITVPEEPSTCSAKGRSSYQKCEDCGENVTEPTELALLSHTPIDVEEKAPTCFEPGYSAGKKCSVCGAALEGAENVPATGEHVYDNGVQTKTPAFEVEGEIVYTCKIPGCGHKKTEKIPALTYEPSAVWDGSEATGFSGGNGTQTSPYLISDAKELAYLARTVNQGNSYQQKYFKLTKDIILNDISEYESWNSSSAVLNRWTSIGSQSKPFAGFLNGDGHAVRGMYGYSSSSSPTCVGLFGYVDAGKFTQFQPGFQNLSVTEAYVYGKATVGGVSAFVNSGVYAGNVNFSGKLYGYTAGGIFGEVNSVVTSVYGAITLDNCKTSGTIACNESVSSNSSANQGYTGGLIGKLSYMAAKITVKNSENSCNISGFRAGGIIGLVDRLSETSGAGATQLIVQSCVNRGKIGSMECNGCELGGIFGRAQLMGSNSNRYAYLKMLSIESCSNYGELTSNYSAGGIAGVISFGDKFQNTNQNGECYAKIENLRNFGFVYGNSYAGGIFADAKALSSAAVSIKRCGNEASVTAEKETGTAGGIAGCSELLDYRECYNSGAIKGKKAGGIAGAASGVCKYFNIYNSGEIQATFYAGGLIGNDNSGVEIDCAYNSGNITLLSSSFSGRKSGSITATGNASTASCYYLETAGSSSLGQKLNEEQMKSLYYFERFDDAVWEIDDNSEYKYPVLKWVNASENA